ncbi:MAG: dipeptidyl peptidase 3, partial [Muribaculaceae bacterium]|nr:dipeptidyl peptidase 3 [Muribaculaceae bacterium]
YNLATRRLLENVYTNYDGDRDDSEFKAFETYLKQVWFANGLHHHYSMDKFTPGFSREFLEARVNALPQEQLDGTDLDVIYEYIFNPDFLAKRVNQAEGQDLILTSAVNMYEGVTQKEVEDYYNAMKDPADETPISYGLNSRVVKGADGKLTEEVYKVGGLYSSAIERIVDNLQKALPYAENETQRKSIEELIAYYQSGDLKTFDEYSITWAQDTLSRVDFINGFIESYGDPLGMTGSWESIVNFKNTEASARTEALSADAQWFEDNSPINPIFRKPHVKGVSAKVINAAILAGDAYPATPIGINLPNANWIRAQHGSKSVTIENITAAYDAASHGNGFNEEFGIDEPTRKILDDY